MMTKELIKTYDTTYSELHRALAWCTPNDDFEEAINDDLMRAQGHIAAAMAKINSLVKQ
jgi:hypothetical protein